MRSLNHKVQQQILCATSSSCPRDRMENVGGWLRYRSLLSSNAWSAVPLVMPLLLAGCGPRITDANIDVVNQQFEAAEKTLRSGVTPKEVESILGQP
jgi:hypothetical protein